ncbi:T9SS type A sorting domain-containing protein [Flavipsychrobacter stenotrophus]|nr:T9SS type A sorting domain-containing protein [Flavipsychrobacter stenotrophus]
MKALLPVIFCVLLFSYSQAQIITTIAGNGTLASSGDGGQATAAGIWGPTCIIKDKVGNLYINQRMSMVRKVTPSGVISTIAGTGVSGFSGDGGPATNAQFTQLYGMALDTAGNLYVVDRGNNRVRKISTSGIVTTFAGTGFTTFTPDGGQATATNIFDPIGILIDNSGAVYICEESGCRIRKVSPSGVVSTFAGNGTMTVSGDGGPATAAGIDRPWQICKGPAGSIIFSDCNAYIRKVSASGIITTIAGNGWTGSLTGTGGPATAAALYYPRGVVADISGNVYIGEHNYVRKIDVAGTINVYTGNGLFFGYLGDGGPASAAEVSLPEGIYIDADGSLYIADNIDNRVRYVKNYHPAFAHGKRQHITVCASGFGLDSLLGITDTNTQQQLTWRACRLPAHGTLSGNFTSLSNGSTVTCAGGFTYTTFAGYTGTDTFSYAVSDGLVEDTAIFHAGVGGLHLPITIWGAHTVCTGDTVHLSGNPSGRTWSGTGSIAAVDTNGVVSGISGGTTAISYINHQCSDDTATYTINVITTTTAAVSITSSADTICNGSSVVYTATAIHGGTTSVWHWYRNGMPAGITTATYTTAALMNGDTIVCKMNTSAACALPATTISNTKVINMYPYVYAAVSITNIPLIDCDGFPTTLTAHPTYGGIAPDYLWSVGGMAMATGNPFSYVPSSGDIVQCRMISSDHAACLATDTAYAAIALTVDPVVTPSIDVMSYGNDSVDFPGEWVHFYTTVTNCGSSPTYQWYENGIAVPGATSATFTTELYASDTVYCIVTSSLPCAQPATVSSNVKVVQGDYLGITSQEREAGTFSIFPQPSTGSFTIITKGQAGEEGMVTLFSIAGQKITALPITIGIPLTIQTDAPSGIYLLSVSLPGNIMTKRMVIIR